MPDDVDPGMLFGQELVTHRAVGADGRLVGLGQELCPALLDEGLVAQELVQLVVDQGDVTGKVLGLLSAAKKT